MKYGVFFPKCIVVRTETSVMVSPIRRRTCLARLAQIPWSQFGVGAYRRLAAENADLSMDQQTKSRILEDTLIHQGWPRTVLPVPEDLPPGSGSLFRLEFFDAFEHAHHFRIAGIGAT